MASMLQPVPITSQKQDPAWKHVQMFKDGERVQLKCIYCGKVFKGGGIHRIKEHLAGQKGNASTCLRVPPDVRLLMQKSLDGVVVKKRKKQNVPEEVTTINNNNTPSREIQPYGDHCEVNTDFQLIGNRVAIEPGSALMVDHEQADGGTRSIEKKKRGRPPRCSLALVSPSNHLVAAANGISSVSHKTSSQVHFSIAQFFYDVGCLYMP